MSEWEYLVDEPITNGNLSRRGQQGWELVSRYGAIGDSWIYKRQKRPKSPAASRCVHCRALVIQVESEGQRVWIHEASMSRGCTFKATEARPLKPWTGYTPLEAFLLALVPVWASLTPETRKDVYRAIADYTEGEELMASAGLRV